jgi:hypothetical protein
VIERNYTFATAIYKMKYLGIKGGPTNTNRCKKRKRRKKYGN